MSMIEVTAAVIRQEKKILICQRPANKNCGLLWEFPGGKIEMGESGEQCIVRECQEELGIMLRVDRELTDVVYEYPDYTVHLHFYLCDIIAGVPAKKEHNAIVWITPGEVAYYEFCPADKKMLQLKQNILYDLIEKSSKN